MGGGPGQTSLLSPDHAVGVGEPRAELGLRRSGARPGREPGWVGWASGRACQRARPSFLTSTHSRHGSSASQLPSGPARVLGTVCLCSKLQLVRLRFWTPFLFFFLPFPVRRRPGELFHVPPGQHPTSSCPFLIRKHSFLPSIHSTSSSPSCPAFGAGASCPLTRKRGCRKR